MLHEVATTGAVRRQDLAPQKHEHTAHFRRRRLPYEGERNT